MCDRPYIPPCRGTEVSLRDGICFISGQCQAYDPDHAISELLSIFDQSVIIQKKLIRKEDGHD